MPKIAQLSTIVTQDVFGNSSPEEREWLASRNIALLWLVELRSFKKDLEKQIATRKGDLLALKPQPDERPSPRYQTVKKEFDSWHRRVINISYKVGERIEAAQLAIKTHGIDMNLELAFDALVKIAEMTREDTYKPPEEVIFSIQRYADKMIDKWTDKVSKSKTPKENTATAYDH